MPKGVVGGRVENSLLFEPTLQELVHAEHANARDMLKHA